MSFEVLETIDIITLKKMSFGERYNYLEKRLQKTLSKYSYLEVSKIELSNFLSEKVNLVKGSNYIKFLNDELEKYFNQILQTKLKENTYLVIENFIKYNAKETNNFKDAIKYLKLLKGFFIKNKIDYEIYFNKLLLENKIINHLLAVIVNEIQKDSMKIQNLDNDVIKEWIDLYCISKNIDIDLDKEWNTDYPLLRKESQTLDSFDMYMNEATSFPLLTETMEKELFLRYRNGDLEARDKIIVSNLRFVIKLAKRFYHGSSKFTFLDLISEGNAGLIKAVNLYNLDYGNRFSSYAYEWILRYMRDFVKRQYRSVKIPMHMYSVLFKIKKMREEEPGISLIEIAKRLNIKPEMVLNLLRYEKDDISLNRTMSTEDDTELEATLLVDYRATDEFLKAEKRIDFSAIISRVTNLTDREKMVLKGVYVDQKSYAALEKEIHIDKNSIRLIHNKALRKITKNKEVIFSLASYTENPLESVKSLGYDEYEYKEMQNSLEQNDEQTRIGEIYSLFLDFKKCSRRYSKISRLRYRDVIIYAIKLGIFGIISDDEITDYFNISCAEVLDIYMSIRRSLKDVKDFLNEFSVWLNQNRKSYEIQKVKTKQGLY